MAPKSSKRVRSVESTQVIELSSSEDEQHIVTPDPGPNYQPTDHRASPEAVSAANAIVQIANNPAPSPLLPQSAFWCFTIFNYTQEIVNALQAMDCEYIVFGKEICPTSGKKHLQGYIEFPVRKRFAAVRALFPPATHLEPRKRGASSLQAANYCKKGNNYVEYINVFVKTSHTAFVGDIFDDNSQ